MKILLTGASGFLGNALLSQWQSKFDVITLGRGDDTNIHCDLSNEVPVVPPIDLVVHAAGKAHVVPKTAQEAKAFYDINVKGTQHLLSGLDNNTSIKKIVFVSSVSVYGLTDGIAIQEDAPLLATDPYGKSKIEAERLITAWCIKRNIDYYILRLPLIAGNNAPGNLGAMVSGIRSGKYLSIGQASAKKSMILAEDIAKFVPLITGESGIYNLTDGYHPSFRELEKLIATFFKKSQPASLPGFAAWILGFTGDLIGQKFPLNSGRLKKITATLTFDDSKARRQLHWQPQQVLQSWEIE